MSAPKKSFFCFVLKYIFQSTEAEELITKQNVAYWLKPFFVNERAKYSEKLKKKKTGEIGHDYVMTK